MRRESGREFLEVGRMQGYLSGSVRRNVVSPIAVPREGGQMAEGKAAWFFM